MQAGLDAILAGLNMGNGASQSLGKIDIRVGPLAGRVFLDQTESNQSQPHQHKSNDCDQRKVGNSFTSHFLPILGELLAIERQLWSVRSHF